MATIPRSGATAVSAAAPLTLATLAAEYIIPDERAVIRYLDDHPDLIDVLAGLPERVAPYIPSSVRPVLEVMHDPESDGSDGPLFALFPTHLAPSDALAQLSRMRNEWWLDLYRRVGGRLNLDVEFR